MSDPAADLVVCRQQLDVLEQQAKAAGPRRSWQTNWMVRSDAAFYETWSPAAVLAWVGWIRQTLDGAEAVQRSHTKFVPRDDHCFRCELRWPCPDYINVTASIAGLAAVLAPTTRKAEK